jgi:putative nucleotidyltransferase with HDIG domain
MPGILRFITRKKLEMFLKRHSEALGLPLVLLDADRRAILAHPADATAAGLASRPLRLAETRMGYVAVPEEASTGKLDLVAGNLQELLEAGYELESLSGEVAKNYEELSNLWRISERLGAGLDVDAICRTLAEEVMGICPAANLSIMLAGEPLMNSPAGGLPSACTKDGRVAVPGGQAVKVLFPKVSLGADASRASTVVLMADRGLVGHAIGRKEAITVCDVSQDSRFEGLPYPVTRILIVPLVVEGSAIGAIVASDKIDGEEFYSTEIKLISGIASECAVSIKKALLFSEVQTMLFDVSEALSLAVEAKDPYTYGHSKRVSRMAAGIARRMGLPSDTVNRIRLAALLHDIGKIGTPEVILHKDALLDGSETDRVREHPVIGSRMVGHIQRLREIAGWICHHHERFDGTGYPSGLKAEEIPLPSRIIAVADFYDAMTSDRPYRKAMKKEDAVDMMRGLSGSHFDPSVLECFETEVSGRPGA